MDTSPRFAVTYGRLNFLSDEEGLETLFVDSSDEVKRLASQFITVIPDDLEDYKADIKKWDGMSQLRFVHQDDDSFFFSADPIKTSTAFTKFSDFVSEFQMEGGDEDEDADD
jgi:hypothetical protein